MTRPEWPLKSISKVGRRPAPGADRPSIVTGAVMRGRSLARRIVPATLNWMTLGLDAALAASMAARSDPAPLSFSVETINVPTSVPSQMSAQDMGSTEPWNSKFNLKIALQSFRVPEKLRRTDHHEASRLHWCQLLLALLLPDQKDCLVVGERYSSLHLPCGLAFTARCGVWVE